MNILYAHKPILPNINNASTLHYALMVCFAVCGGANSKLSLTLEAPTLSKHAIKPSCFSKSPRYSKPLVTPIAKGSAKENSQLRVE